MDPPPAGTVLLVAALLLAANAFFVAAEFALVATRRGRLERQASRGERGADRALRLLDRAGELSLVSQLGSSTCGLLLGGVLSWWAVTGAPPDAGGGAVMLRVGGALGIGLVLHAVVGSQLPKLIAIQRAEAVAVRLTLPVLSVAAVVLQPLTFLLGRLLAALGRLLRMESRGFHRLVHTPEEIRLLVDEGHQRGVFQEDAREMVYGVFELGQTVAREVMTPRTDVVGIPLGTGLDRIIEIAVDGGHSRLPVFEGSIDNVVGVLLVKDLLAYLRTAPGGREFDLEAIAREPYFVPDTKPISDLLQEFRAKRVHFAIVLDEFGGTYGLVTLEDLLEEIVGEITDEYDVAEQPEFTHTPEGDVLIDGAAPISEVNERFDLGLPESDFDTIGGFIFGSLGRVPVVGDVVVVPRRERRLELRVEDTEERRVVSVRLSGDLRAAPRDGGREGVG